MSGRPHQAKNVDFKIKHDLQPSSQLRDADYFKGALSGLKEF